MSIIELRNLNKTYKVGESKLDALKDLNLSIEEGELIAIIGPSGSGKSTLLNIIGLLDKQTSGDYIYNKENIKDINKRKIANFRNENFGFVVQNFALINYYNVFENIRIPLEYSKFSKKDIISRISFLSERLQIADLLKKKPTQLSGGQCQRVTIARAMATNPKLILADEPTGALDSKNGQIVIDLFKELNEEGITIIIVTHDLNIANQCNRIIELSDGKIMNV